MKVLIVYASPHRKGLNGAFLDSAIAGLSANESKPEFRIIDLYAEGFDPKLFFAEANRRRDLCKDPGTAAYREALLWAETILFIYPIWWGRPPAMLLGFFDRVLSSGFAYRDRPGSALPEGLLKGRSAICVSTMQGPSGYLQLWLGNAHRILMKRAVLNFVGIRDVKFFEFGSMESQNGRQRQKIGRIGRYMAKLRAPLRRAS